MSESRDNVIELDLSLSLPPFSPICHHCKHLDDDDSRTCAAFLDGIPDVIWRAERDHRKPYPGDHGIRFEPIDDDADALVADLFDKEGGR